MKDKLDNSSKAEGVGGVIEYILSKSNILFKSVPLAVGFLIFLIYFCQNNFFPSFDVFSLTSLLIAAFVIGLAAYLVLVFGIAAPGFFWFDTFAQDSQVKEELEYSSKWRSSYRNNENYRVLGRIYLFLPLLFCNLFFLWMITSGCFDYTWQAALSVFIPFTLCLLAAAELRRDYLLGFGSVIKYVITTFFSIFLSSAVNMIVILMVMKAHFETADNAVQMLVAVVTTVALVVAFFVTAIAGLTHYKYTVLFSALFAILFTIIIGAWATFPKNIVKMLGIGNYAASEVLLKGEACKEMTAAFKEFISDKCVIKEANVVWSLGETYRLQVSSNASHKVISLPSASIAAILVSPAK